MLTDLPDRRALSWGPANHVVRTGTRASFIDAMQHCRNASEERQFFHGVVVERMALRCSIGHSLRSRWPDISACWAAAPAPSPPATVTVGRAMWMPLSASARLIRS